MKTRQFYKLCKNGNLEELKKEIEINAKFDIHIDNDNAILYACKYGNSHIAIFLLSIDDKTKYDVKYLQHKFTNACLHGKSSFIEQLIKIGDTFTNNIYMLKHCFLYACGKGFIAIVRQLLPFLKEQPNIIMNGFLNACSFGRLNVIKYIYNLHKCNEVHIPTYIQNTKWIDEAVMETCKYKSHGHLHVVKYFTSIEDEYVNLNHKYNRLYEIVCENGHLSILKHFVEIEFEQFGEFQSYAKCIECAFTNDCIPIIEYLNTIHKINNINVHDIGTILCENDNLKMFQYLHNSYPIDFDQNMISDFISILCRYRHINILKYMIFNKFDISSSKFESILMLFLCKNKVDDTKLIDIFIKTYNINLTRDEVAFTQCFSISCKHGKLNTIKYLIDLGSASRNIVVSCFIDVCQFSWAVTYNVALEHLLSLRYPTTHEYIIDQIIITKGFQYACRMGILERIKYLLRMDEERRPLIHYDNEIAFILACSSQRYDVIHFMLFGFDKPDIRVENDIAFKNACKTKDLVLVKMLSSVCPDYKVNLTTFEYEIKQDWDSFLELLDVEYGICNICDEEEVLFKLTCHPSHALCKKCYIKIHEYGNGKCPFCIKKIDNSKCKSILDIDFEV